MEGAVGISPDTLVSLLSGSGDQPTTLVLDCRPFMAYNTGHVVDALNVHCPPILKRRSGGFVALENIVPCPVRRERLLRGGYSGVVVYDQATRDLASARADRDSNLYSVAKSLIQQVDLESVCYLVGGYEVFSEDCPLLCATQQFCALSSGRPAVDSTHPVSDDQPVEILPHLLLGNVHHSMRRELLQRLGITAIINVSSSCSNHFPAHFRYLRIPANDSATEDLASWFSTANRFIDEVRSEAGRTLVHCHAGRSRSATVCLAYLMASLGLSLDSAFEHVRSRREVIDPNLNFMRQLQDYGQRLALMRGTSSAVTATPPSSAMDMTRPTPPPAMGGFLPQPLPTPVMGMPLQPIPTPMEAATPVSVSSSSRLGVPSPTDSVPPTSSPAMATDVQCFFSFSPTSAGDSAFSRTPAFFLPS